MFQNGLLHAFIASVLVVCSFAAEANSSSTHHPPPHAGITLVIASHKTGSSFLDVVFSGIARTSELCMVRLDFLNHGDLAQTPEGLNKLCPHGGFLFGRKVPSPLTQKKMIDAMAEVSPSMQCRGIFQTRNPYDVIVSQFQSFTQNHALPAGLSEEMKQAEILKRKAEHEAGVDLYAKKHFPEVTYRLRNTRDFAALIKNSKKCDAMFSLYEEMTTTPEDWAHQIANFIKIKRGTKSYGFLQRKASEQHNVKPDEHKHTAYFLPGSHLRLLNVSTLNSLY
mmetsp:Transcript_43455/g.55808  ORF Transcript_43455/g.55808 Transcript_43455/m.55808 type:complete len:280 (-) Transcript_43455:117-956(-)